VPPRRFADAVETTAYLVVSRAAAHGPATVCATHTDGVLAVEVKVDALIDGLGDLEDRVRALDGRLTVAAEDERTQIDLSLPVVGSYGAAERPEVQRQVVLGEAEDLS
jgi:hypothetical protein